MLTAARAEVQILVILAGAVIGWLAIRPPAGGLASSSRLPRVRGARFATSLLVLFFAILVASPIINALADSHWVSVFDAFYRAGSLIFGGGHVVLPLLQSEVVPPGWVTIDEFTAGYGAAQAVPGPLSTFAAYLGVVMGPEPSGWTGAVICLVAIFLPSFLLIFGALPFWDQLRIRPEAQSVLRGVNAAVVGILLAALYDPVWTAGINSGADFALGAAAFLLLYLWKTPPWIVVVLCALGGAAIGRF
jgi:chromate transporter